MAETHWLDDSLHPIWVQTLPASPEPGEFERAFDYFDERIRELAEGTVRLGLVVDMRSFGMGTSVLRRRAAQTNELANALLPGRILGQAVVLESPVHRGALTAVQWLARPSWPVRTFAKRDEALQWIQALQAAD